MEGKRGTSVLNTFLEDAVVHETPPESERVASLEGIAVADASVILLADTGEVILLANAEGLIEVARSHGVECWWVTTSPLKCTKGGVLTGDEATDVSYDLVDEGVSIHPKVYAQVQKKLRKLGD